MKKIPYGISDFKKLREMDYYYIDKTIYLEKLEDTAETIIYLRPRRFGKTLFTSMMYYYYDINSKDIFDDLFKDTYIYNHPTKNKNNYNNIHNEARKQISKYSVDRENEKKFIIIFTGTNYTLEEV